jgi:hypothetical protein
MFVQDGQIGGFARRAPHQHFGHRPDVAREPGLDLYQRSGIPADRRVHGRRHRAGLAAERL